MLVARSPSWISLSPLVRAMLLYLILFGQPIGQLNIAGCLLEAHVVIKIVGVLHWERVIYLFFEKNGKRR
jgi:hypothetical protein